MARRAALARAFSVEPEVLLLDEPFVSLDEPTANRLRDLLVELWRSSPVTVLMVTHNLREAVRLADRLIVLSPRPAHVLGVMDVPLPREERRGAGARRADRRDLPAAFPASPSTDGRRQPARCQSGSARRIMPARSASRQPVGGAAAGKLARPA